MEEMLTVLSKCLPVMTMTPLSWSVQLALMWEGLSRYIACICVSVSVSNRVIRGVS